MKGNVLIFTVIFIFSLIISASEAFSSENGASIVLSAPPSADPQPPKSVLTEGDEILVRSSQQGMVEARNKARVYSIKAAGAFPIYDADFRDFIDYGASIVVGIEKEIKPNISIQPTLGLVALTGDWKYGSERETIRIEAEEYYPGNISGASTPITAEDLSDANLGIGYHSEGEAVITSAELLSNVDIETDLYIFPLVLNVVYRPKDLGKKIKPYIGGGLGFCLARRDVESRILKENSYQGPEYRVTLNDSQTVTGQILHFLAGVEIPFKNNMKIVAEASTTIYDLKRFDPIIEIAYRKPTPSSYEGSDDASWTYEDPIGIGVFKEEFVTSLSIGLVIPF